MKYVLVHVSDLHVRGDDSHLDEKFGALKMLVADQSGWGEYAVICLFTGDLAFSGKSTEYEILKKYLRNLAAEWDSRKIAHKFIFAPGNHDCDFNHPFAETRKLLVAHSSMALSRESPKPQVLGDFLSIQTGFTKFCEDLGQLFPLDRLAHTYFFPDLRLRVNVLNTAWASEINESSNRPFVLNAIDDIPISAGCLNVTIYHHPNSWIDKTISHDFKRRVTEVSDFVFSGHEHESQTYEAKYLNGDSQTYFEAGKFHEDDEDGGQFRIVKVDLIGKKFTVSDLIWESSQRAFKALNSGDLSIPSSTQTNAKGFSIKLEFASKLRDPGVSLKHSLKRDLELRDFFVFPRVSIDPDQFDGSPPIRFVTSENDFLETIQEKQLNLLTGGDKAGKSSLCKIVFEGLFAKGCLPVLVHGVDLTHANEPFLRNLIGSKMKEQYSNATFDAALQDSELKLILIVDSFDLSPLSARKSGEAVEILEKFFGHILFTADTSIEVQVLDDPRFGVSLDKMSRFQVAPFNMVQRKLLMAKWKSIGNVSDVDGESAQIHQLELTVNSVMGEFGIPFYPLFILICLQNLEIETGVDLKLSSNAKLMERLVEDALSSVHLPSISYQARFAYLRELAFEMYSSRKPRLSFNEIDRFHEAYCKKRDIVVNKDLLWHALTECKILNREEDGTGWFRYTYIKSFFVAEYFRFNLAKPEIRSALEEIVDNIHLLENANIVATLSVFSSETWIIKRLTAKLNSFLPSVPVSSYLDLSDLVTEITKVSAIGLLPSATKEDENDTSEEKTPISQPPEAAVDINGDPVQLVDSITNAIRLIKVIGQLLRNSVNSLEGDEKKEIIETVVNAAGRVIGLQIYGLKQEKEELLGYIFHRVREKNPQMAEPEVKEEASRRLVNLSFGTLVGLLDTVSRAIGDDFLAPTYRRVEEGDLTKNSKIYLFAIRLDWYKAFPKNEVLEVFESIRGRPFAELIIRYLAFRSLAFRGNDIGGATLQEITSRLEIDYRRLLNRQLIAAKPSHQ